MVWMQRYSRFGCQWNDVDVERIDRCIRIASVLRQSEDMLVVDRVSISSYLKPLSKVSILLSVTHIADSWIAFQKRLNRYVK